MGYQYPAFITQTSTTTGTGTITLNGSVANQRTFDSRFAVATSVYYIIKGETYFEHGIGSFDPGTQQLTRTAVIFSSNADSLVNLPAGTHTVYVTYPGEPLFYDAFTGNITLSNVEHGNVKQFTGTVARTVSLQALSTVPPGFKVAIFNDGTQPLTLDGNASETIEGATTFVLSPGEWGVLSVDASQWRFKIGVRRASVSIASASTVDLATVPGNVVHITGNTGPVTSFGSPPAGAEFTLVFDSNPVVNNTANILMPHGGHYQTAAGTRMRVASEGAGVVRVVGITHAGGVANYGKVTIASASTVDLSNISSSLVHISGNTGPITSFGSPPAGAEFQVVLDSNPQINSGSNIVTPGSANIVGSAGVALQLVSEGAGVVRITNITSGSGLGWAWNGGATPVSFNNSWNHSLGVHPRKALVRACLVCVSTDAGYAVGDAIPLFSTTPGNNSNFLTTLCNDADGNTSRVIIGGGAGGIEVAHKSTGAVTQITYASWTLYIGVQLEF